MDSPASIQGAGFASITVALFTIFRPTPFLLLKLITRMHSFCINVIALELTVWLWISVVFTVLFWFGTSFLIGNYVQKKWLLEIHPWGLLLLYFDVFVWVSLILMVHIETVIGSEICSEFINHIKYPIIYFTIMYIESVFYGVVYFFYATFFIAAELTAIEKFYLREV